MPTTRKGNAAHAAALLPLAIGLTMNGVAPKSHATTDHATVARSTKAVSCSQFDIDGSASRPLIRVAVPPNHLCSTHMSHGFPLPDRSCTPGAVNPTVTIEVLQDPAFRTSCIREQASSRSEKNATYDSYNLTHPDHNTGQTQTCELDHLISLELGGADTVDNIWPQCGRDDVPLPARYFKRKDSVENLLAAQVKAGTISLKEAQVGIATDWTQFLDEAEQCEGAACEE
jgi:hypothetical protein